MFGMRGQGVPAVEVDGQHLCAFRGLPAGRPREARDRFAAPDGGAGRRIDTRNVQGQRRIIEIQSAGQRDGQRQRVFPGPGLHDGMPAQVVVFEILLGSGHPHAVVAVLAVGVVEPQQHLGPRAVGSVRPDTDRLALGYGTCQLRFDHPRDVFRLPESTLEHRLHQIALHGERPEPPAARLHENRLNRIIAHSRRDIGLVAVGFGQHLAAAARKAVEDDLLRNAVMAADRVGQVDRRGVHVVQGDADAVVEHLPNIAPHQALLHEETVVIVRIARLHRGLGVHVIPFGGDRRGEGEAHFAPRPVGRAERLAEAVGIGRHVAAAQVRRRIKIGVRKRTSVNRRPGRRKSRLFAVVLRQQHQQRLVVFQGRDSDPHLREIGPGFERQRDFGRYLPGFIAEGIDVFRGGGKSGLSGSSGSGLTGLGILTQPASSRAAEANNREEATRGVFIKQKYKKTDGFKTESYIFR